MSQPQPRRESLASTRVAAIGMVMAVLPGLLVFTLPVLSSSIRADGLVQARALDLDGSAVAQVDEVAHVAHVAHAAEVADEAGASAERGRVLMQRYHCGTCHTIPGVAAARSGLAADLSDYGRRSYIAGRWPNLPDTLARWIAEPAALAPGTLMPSMGVAPADARDMAAYLLSLPPR